MINLRKLFCRHNCVYIKRVHLDSKSGKAHRDKYVYIDKYHCANLICCAECNKVLSYEKRETIYEST